MKESGKRTAGDDERFAESFEKLVQKARDV